VQGEVQGEGSNWAFRASAGFALRKKWLRIKWIERIKLAGTGE
jgi:hypothetical protein